MTQKLVQSQALQQVQTLSPQQVLQVRLLEMPLSEMEQRVQHEMLENGALEERINGMDEDVPADEQYAEGNEEGMQGMENQYEAEGYQASDVLPEMNDYRSPDDVPDYLWKAASQRNIPENVEYGDTVSFYELMMDQMNESTLTDHERELMEYLIGSLESDGLLKKRLSVIADELEVYNGIITDVEELEGVLKRLQEFDPPGVGARDLRECLLIQIRRDENYRSGQKQKEYEIISRYFDDFTRKRWDRIRQRMGISEAEAERLRNELKRLNPRPGSAMGEVIGHNFEQIVPDFVAETDDDGDVRLHLNKGNVPELCISPSFQALLEEAGSERSRLSRSEREALQYTRQKIEKAQSFIEAVKMRRDTLSKVMKAIVDLQYPFFREGDETLVRPMILKDVAERTGLDISTVSRATNGKYVETHYGTYSLKWFFSDGFVTEDGQEVAVRKIQAELRECIENEDADNPYSDEALAAMLNKKGYPIARRTVAKYREQLGIPVARLRRC